MTTATSQNLTRAPHRVWVHLCARVMRLCEQLQRPEYGDDSWCGSVSLLLSSPPSAGKVITRLPDERIVVSALYDPAQNARWVTYEDVPHPMAEVSAGDIADLNAARLRPLVFDHIRLAEEVPFDLDVLQADAIVRRLKPLLIPRALLLHGFDRSLLKPVNLFLSRYPDISPNAACALNPTCLSLNLPFRNFPHCLWLGQIPGQHGLRLFDQPLSYDGFPLGPAQSWPASNADIAQTGLYPMLADEDI